jgi:hypothetical protein
LIIEKSSFFNDISKKKHFSYRFNHDENPKSDSAQIEMQIKKRKTNPIITSISVNRFQQKKKLIVNNN